MRFEKVLKRLASRSLHADKQVASPGQQYSMRAAALGCQAPVGNNLSFSTQTRPLLYRASMMLSINSPDSSSVATPKKKRKHAFIPQSAAVKLTESARTFFKRLLETPPRPEIIGIMLNLSQSKEGDMRMVFSFQFVSASDLAPTDEPVSLEVLEDGITPKPFVESMNDGLPKLYVNGDAFLKVLGASVDIDKDSLTPILHDREGNIMDPNA